MPSDSARAQQYIGTGKYGRSVIVNPEVLNSLGGGPMVQALPYRPGTTAYYNPTVPYSQFGGPPQGGLPLARPGNLLFPPVQRPTSQIVAPVQQPQYASPVVPAYPPQPQAAL